MLSKLPPLRNGQPTADWCMAVAEFLDALQTTTGGGGFRNGVTIDQTGMSFQEYDKSVFLATITGRSGSAYAWTRLVSSTGGVNGTDGYGASGTTSLLPAYHVTGATSIANGTVVLMWPADSENEMRFVNGFDPSNLIDLSGRSGSIADVTAAQFLRTTVSGTAGATVVTPDDASETLPGDITTGTQNLAGAKRLNGSLACLDNTFATYDGAISLDPNSGANPRITASRQSLSSAAVALDFDNTPASRKLILYGDATDQASYAVRDNTNTLRTGATGTTGGGDTVYGGIITTLGTAPDPADIDGGAWT